MQTELQQIINGLEENSMQIGPVTINAASLAAAQVIQENGNQIQPEGNLFGPSCLVTISREGRNLSRQQAVRSGQETEGVKDVREHLRQLEKAEQEKKAEEKDREGLHDAEKAEKAEKIARALSDPDEDDALKAALRENFEMSSGGELTNEDLEKMENVYEWFCREMAEGHIQVSIEEVSDGIIDDRKRIHVRRLTAEDGNHEESDNAKKAVSSLRSPDEEKAEANKSSRDIPGLKGLSRDNPDLKEKKYEEFKVGFAEFRDWITKMHMVPSLLERYSEAEMGQRIESYFERIFEELYEYSTDIGDFTDEEWVERNVKRLENQVPLSEQEKAVETFAKRLTPADRANVTRIESGDLTALPDMPKSES